MKRIIIALFLSLSLLFVSCSNEADINNQEVVEEVEQYEVEVMITVPDEVDDFSPVEPMTVSAESGESIIDVIQKTDLELDINGSGEDAFLEGINGLKTFDEGSESGWLVKVNGELIDVGPGAYFVEEGDEIEWIYTTDFNEIFES